MSQKDIKKLLKKLTHDGWRIEQGQRHFKAYHPQGGFVTISVSPSCPYALRNILGDIKRLTNSHSQNLAGAVKELQGA